MKDIIVTEIADLISKICGNAPISPLPRPNYPQYQDYLLNNKATADTLNKQRTSLPMSEAKCPLVSVIMIGAGSSDTEIDSTIMSLMAQTYTRWELIIAFELSRTGVLRFKDVEHVRVVQLDGTYTQLLKAADAQLRGDVCMFLRAGDRLAPDALFALIQQFACGRNIDMVFADNDCFDTDLSRVKPFFKPDYSPISELCFDMVGRPLLVTKQLHEAVNGYSGISDEDYHNYVIRCGNKARNTSHAARILLTSTTSDIMPVKQAFSKSSNDRKRGSNQSVHFADGIFAGSRQVRYGFNTKASVGIILPCPKNARLLQRCLESIDTRSIYQNYRIFIGTNAETETDPEVNSYLSALKSNNAASIIRSEKDDTKTIPGLANQAAECASSDFLVFMNPHAEVLSPDFIERLIEPLYDAQTSICGGKLYTPENTLYSVGTVIGLKGWAESPYINTRDDLCDLTKCTFTSMQRNVSAVSGEFMAMRSEVFFNLGRFDETLPYVGWDTELCIRAMRRSKLCVFTPYATARLNTLPISYETASAENLTRCYDVYRETLIAGDKYYNNNFDYNISIPTPAVCPYKPITLNPLYGG